MRRSPHACDIISPLSSSRRVRRSITLNPLIISTPTIPTMTIKSTMVILSIFSHLELLLAVIYRSCPLKYLSFFSGNTLYYSFSPELPPLPLKWRKPLLGFKMGLLLEGKAFSQLTICNFLLTVLGSLY